jgi:hypothetical protein
LLSLAGLQTPKFNKAVWRGNVNSSKRVRSALLKIGENKFIDCADTGNLINESEKFIPFVNQVSDYKFLINLSSYGYSKRLKYMMFSRRPVLIADRDYKEWFWPMLKPWVHYVPVKRDLSDLTENIKLLNSEENVASQIASNAYSFAINNLRYANALERFNFLLNIQDSKPNRFEDLEHRIVDGYCREND